MRKSEFTTNEYYHIFNRGVDKRIIFLDREDMERFFQSMQEFNVINPIGSIYENYFLQKQKKFGDRDSKQKKLVNFTCYCLNSNHYHFILEQLVDKGIEKFMHRLGLGYAMFFNNKYDRSGALFQGRYKAIHIDSNEYLLYLSSYVNLNNKVHSISLGDRDSKSSWNEYVQIPNKQDKENKQNHNENENENENDFCEKSIILDQFDTPQKYKEFALDALEIIKENKELE